MRISPTEESNNVTTFLSGGSLGTAGHQTEPHRNISQKQNAAGEDIRCLGGARLMSESRVPKSTLGVVALVAEEAFVSRRSRVLLARATVGSPLS